MKLTDWMPIPDTDTIARRRVSDEAHAKQSTRRSKSSSFGSGDKHAGKPACEICGSRRQRNLRTNRNNGRIVCIRCLQGGSSGGNKKYRYEDIAQKVKVNHFQRISKRT